MLLPGCWLLSPCCPLASILNWSTSRRSSRRCLCELLRRLLRVHRSPRRALRRLCHSVDVARNFSAAVSRFAHVPRHFVRCRVLLLDRRGYRTRNPIHLIDHFADRGNRLYCGLGVSLYRFNLAADVFRRLRRLFRQFLYFIRNNRKSFSRFAGTRCFDRGIQGQQVRLLRNRRNHLDHLPNLVRRFPQL